MSYNVTLTQEEIEVLKLPPKFCIRKKLTRKTFDQDLELCNTKMRYEGDTDEEEDIWENEEEKESFRERETMMDAENREIFEKETKTFDYRKRRATDVKENNKSILPRALNTKSEAGKA